MNRNWRRHAEGGLPILAAALLSAAGLLWQGAGSEAVAQASGEVIVNYDVLDALSGQGAAPAPLQLRKPGTGDQPQYGEEAAAEAQSAGGQFASVAPPPPAEVPTDVPMLPPTPPAPAPGVNAGGPPASPAVEAPAPAADPAPAAEAVVPTQEPPAPEQQAEPLAQVEPAPVQPVAAQPAPVQPAPEQPAAAQPAPEQPAPEQAAQEQPAQEQPAQEQPTEEQAAQEQPAETPPAEGEAASTDGEEQPTDEAAAEAPAESDNSQPAAPIPQGGIRIVFPTELNDVPVEANAALDDLAAQMLADESMRIQISCYASGSEDTESKARRKSLQRCLNIRQYLFKKNVITTRIDVRALGLKSEGQPADRVDIVPANS